LTFLCLDINEVAINVQLGNHVLKFELKQEPKAFASESKIR
jgi:hypothetical protein